jgi:hypothetical protein
MKASRYPCLVTVGTIIKLENVVSACEENPLPVVPDPMTRSMYHAQRHRRLAQPPADHIAQATKHAAPVTPTVGTISCLKYERMGHEVRHDHTCVLRSAAIELP